MLPTVRELAAEVGVNYNTIHRVYQDLETDGLILSQRGKRSLVNSVDQKAVQLPESPVDLVIDELVRIAHESGITKEDVIMRLEDRYEKTESNN